jgi:translation initiation factor 1
MDICPKCGLPLQACVCEEIAKTDQRIQIKTEKKRFGKLVTIVTGFQGVDLKALAKNLKQELACGGTIKDNVIELQGEHSKKVREILRKQGFGDENIKIV